MSFAILKQTGSDHRHDDWSGVLLVVGFDEIELKTRAIRSI